MSQNTEAQNDHMHLMMQATIAGAIDKGGLSSNIVDPYFYRLIPQYGFDKASLHALGGEQYAVTGTDVALRIGLQPFASKNEQALKALCAHKRYTIGRTTMAGFPMRSAIDNGSFPMYDRGHGMLVGSDIILHLDIDGERKIIQTQRDLEAPIFPGFWSCAGGYATESPSRTGIKELNEETGIVLDNGKNEPLAYLLLRAEGQTGQSIQEKAQSIDVLRTYLTRRYPGSFDPQRAIQVKVLDLAPVAYKHWQPVQITITDDGRTVDTLEALPSLSPSRSSLTLLRPYALPKYDSRHPALAALQEGKDCFIADLEFGGRNIHPFSLPEMAAIQQAGKYFDNVLNFLHQTQMLKGITPARQVLARTNEGKLAPAF
ncbi:MAG: hypothetical protein PHW63_09485 [Alphaproteobacteria bacterium]|nr:hypothetical protein [Alphaproteobacteria bacterium]